MDMEEKMKKERLPRIRHTAQQKAQAVLEVWTERKKPSEICRALGVRWTILDQWQKRAMEGMLQALEPYAELENASGLSPRLQALLMRRSVVAIDAKLAKRSGRKAEKSAASQEADMQE